MSQPVEPMTVVSLVSLGLLCALLLRKVFTTERFHALRVALLTALLWAAAFYLFGLAFPTQHGCDHLDFDERSAYTCTEM